MINVVVVHEFSLMCSIISSVLNDEPDINVVAGITDTGEALECAKQNDVDVILISSRLPEQGSIYLAKKLMQRPAPPKILILGITETKENVLRYIESGATGYVLKENSLDDLLEAIRAAYNGKALVSPEIAEALIQRVSEYAQVLAQAGSPLPNSVSLTPREFEVLELMSANFSNHDIAKRLVIEIGTVKNHVHSILHKLGVSSREDAAQLMTIISERVKHVTDIND